MPPPAATAERLRRAPPPSIGLLLFVGATGKSAQIPLYVWLPDAMAGPTPVSALIHAATMVTAGVYMVARLQRPLSRSRPTAMLVGGRRSAALTALFAATIGLVAERHQEGAGLLHRVASSATCSSASGVGAFAAGDLPPRDPRLLQGLPLPRRGLGHPRHAAASRTCGRWAACSKHMPITYWTFLVATLAIAGIPPFAGFFSKDEILGKAFAAGDADLNGSARVLVLWALAVAGALLTAFYMFRAGLHDLPRRVPRRRTRPEHHLHESPRTMTVPLHGARRWAVDRRRASSASRASSSAGRAQPLRALAASRSILPIGSGHGATRRRARRATALGVEWALIAAVGRGRGLRHLARLPVLRRRARLASGRAGSPSASRALYRAAAQQVLRGRALRRHRGQRQLKARRAAVARSTPG